jgi:uncharacterized protein YjbI with pentapeptide repeats
MFDITPRLFISYAREDIEFARSLNKALANAGFQVFFDESSILIGDIFPDRIINELKKADGCIVLVTDYWVKSEWCKLEAYYTHFFRKMFIPIKIGTGDYDLESPLRSIQKNVQYVTVTDTTNTTSIINLIRSKLKVVKRNAQYRIIKRAGLLLSICSLIVFIFTFGVNRINRLVYNNDKSVFLESVRKSTKIYNNQEIELMKDRFKNDKELIAQVHLQETDPSFSDIARINSKIVSSALLQSFSLSSRQYLKNVEWFNSTYNNGVLSSTTFISGNISKVTFDNSKFNDVYFAGTDSGRGGIALSGLVFSNCNFNAVSLNKNNAIDLKFKACTFNGSFLNTTDFGAVNFFSVPEENPAVITNGVMTSFMNCTFQNDNGPDPAGTIVLGKEEEMQFKEVLFDGCRFIGLVRPEWFNKCTFLNCYFPSNLVINQLKGGNIMNDSGVN